MNIAARRFKRTACFCLLLAVVCSSIARALTEHGPGLIGLRDDVAAAEAGSMLLVCGDRSGTSIPGIWMLSRLDALPRVMVVVRSAD